MGVDRYTAAVRIMRWLASELASEHHGLAHVPQQVADLLLDGPPAGSCRSCGGELPPQQRTGRPRVLCLSCSPRKTQEKAVLPTEPTNEEVA